MPFSIGSWPWPWVEGVCESRASLEDLCEQQLRLDTVAKKVSLAQQRRSWFRDAAEIIEELRASRTTRAPDVRATR